LGSLSAAHLIVLSVRSEEIVASDRGESEVRGIFLERAGDFSEGVARARNPSFAFRPGTDPQNLLFSLVAARLPSGIQIQLGLPQVGWFERVSFRGHESAQTMLGLSENR